MVDAQTIAAELTAELDVAEAKAWDALARYKFQMFGYWCAIWVHLNRIGGFKRPNPWATLVTAARSRSTQVDADQAETTAPHCHHAWESGHRDEDPAYLLCTKCGAMYEDVPENDRD